MHTIDLTDQTLKQLSEFANRLAALLTRADNAKNQPLIHVLDDLLGVVYALIAAREEEFKGKPGPSEFRPVIDRAKQLAKGVVKAHGPWMAGFHFNSALYRISAVLDRLPQALSKSAKKCGVAYTVKTGKKWNYKDADRIREEVIDLKHREGNYKGRKTDMPIALNAVAQLLDLAETLA